MKNVIALLAVLVCATPVRAEDEVLTAAHACFMEASFHLADCAAIIYVAKRLAGGRPWVDVLRGYSAVDANNARAAEVRSYPDADVDGAAPGFNRQWARLRAYVRRVISGEVRDPCHATDWGSRVLAHDVERAARAVREGRWVSASCVTGTANAFYRRVRR